MSDVKNPASIAGGGATPGSGGETVAAGAMHLSGGSYAEMHGLPGMQFLAASGLQVDFVDLSTAAPAAQTAGPITFADWRTAGTSVPAAGFDAAAHHAAGLMLADFSSRSGGGMPGGGIQPNGSGRVAGGSFGDPGMPDRAWVIPPHLLP